MILMNTRNNLIFPYCYTSNLVWAAISFNEQKVSALKQRF